MHEAEHFTIEAEHFNIETEHFKVDSDFILEPLDIQRFRLPLIFWPWSKTVRLAARMTVLHGSNQTQFL